MPVKDRAKFPVLPKKDLQAVVGGNSRYGASGNRFVHCATGIVGGALIGAIGGSLSALTNAVTGGLASCRK